MMRVKLLAMAAAVAGGLGLASAAVACDAVTNAAFGCGPGFAPNRLGICRPIYRPFGFYARPQFYRPYGFYGPRRFYGRRW